MNLKTKLRNYGFWVALIAIVVSVVAILNKYYNLNINTEMIIAIGGVLCSALISFGIIKSDEAKLISDIKEDITKATEIYQSEQKENEQPTDEQTEETDTTDKVE